MDPSFWHERWAKGEIAFHQPAYNAHMQAFTNRLEVETGAHIFVPLCGKSLDMLWLLRKGFRVTGVEISPRAAQDFFTENRLHYRVTDLPDGRLFSGERLDIYCADFFTVDLRTMPALDAVYDRAALIALPQEMRQDYVDRLALLMPAGVRSLLVTLDYPPQEMSGPPFSVTPDEVERLFTRYCRIDHLHSEDCLEHEPRFRKKGLTRLEEHVFLLQRMPEARGAD